MIGIDIEKIERIREKATSDAFIKSVFTKTELDYYVSRGKRAETLAGMYCAKEAVAKAFGTGFRGFRPNDISISHSELGAPKVELSGKAAELSGGKDVKISISHSGEYAIAVCLII